MPRKQRKYTCIICKKEFESRSLNPSTCSKKCKSELYKNINKKKYKDVRITIKCDYCGIEKIKPKSLIHENNFCSKECFNNWQKVNGEKQLIVRKKISNALSGRSLRDRGFTEESIGKWVQAGRKASIKRCKGKKLEEIVGINKAKEIRKKRSNMYSGDGNPQSLENLAKRNNCTLEEARKLTSCYGRTGKKHPMFGVHMPIESVKSMMEKLQDKCKFVSIGYFNNILWQGTYELAYLIYCYENNIPIKRFNLEPIEYIYKKNKHSYFPDYIIYNNIIIECKGKIDDVVNEKINAAEKIFGKDYYRLIDANFIKNIKPNCSVKSYFKIVKEKYYDIFNVIYLPKRYKNDKEMQEILNENKC